MPRHDGQKPQPLQLLQAEMDIRLAQAVLLGQLALRRQPVARAALPAEDLLEHPVKKSFPLRAVSRILLFHNHLCSPLDARIVLHFQLRVKRNLRIFWFFLVTVQQTGLSGIGEPRSL